MATIGIGIFVITYFISQFGEKAVAAYGIATRIEQIVLLPTIGLTIAALSIVGQNNGAKKYERIKETLKLCLRYGLTIMSVGAVALFFTKRLLMTVFTKDLEVINIGSHYLGIACLIFLAYPLLFITISTLQGMKRPMYPVWIGLYRQILAPIVVFYFLVNVLDWGIDGIWWGIFGITWSAGIITILYARYVLKKIN